jgi:diguanylate cyclase (GGDEF)-like protein/PAS domain S-box-containing protein
VKPSDQKAPLILIADDDKVIRLALRRVMKQAGYRVIEAENGEQCLAEYTKHRPDVVLLDAVMPVMDGFAACKQLRSLAGSSPLIFLITSLEDDTSITQGFEEGVDDFVLKPIHWKLLQKRVGYLLQAKRTKEALRESEASLAVAQRVAHIGSWDLDLVTNKLQWSAEIYRIFGFLDYEVSATYEVLLERIHPDDRVFVQYAMDRALYEQETFSIDYRVVRPDETERIVHSRAEVIFNEDGWATRMVGIVHDITERKLAENKLTYMAHHDPLTGLYNRQYLLEKLQRILKIKNLAKGALLFVDLDNFKIVNDTLGHATGDRLLNTLSSKLKYTLREEDIFARIGGDEFALLLEEATPEEAQGVAERLVKFIEAFRYSEEGVTFTIGSSVGMAYIETNMEAEELLSRADRACYVSKARGGNRIEVYQPGQEELQLIVEEASWTTRIKDALREQGFSLWFQPVFHLATEQVDHYEVLLRMKGKQGEVILPGAFIPSAERFGFMSQIDYWVVQAAVHCLAAHPELHLAVNLSGKSLSDPALKDFISLNLRQHSVEPNRLSFEITETAAVVNFEHARVFIKDLKDLGCKFALDDFGVGFASFTYLRELPVDYLKIDGSFIRNLDQDPINQVLVRSIHEMARALDKKTIAEFVENEAILHILQEIGVDYAQGYHLGRPGPDL